MRNDSCRATFQYKTTIAPSLISSLYTMHLMDNAPKQVVNTHWIGSGWWMHITVIFSIIIVGWNGVVCHSLWFGYTRWIVVYKVHFYLRVYFNAFNARAMDGVFIVQILGIFIDLSRKKPSKKRWKNTTWSKYLPMFEPNQKKKIFFLPLDTVISLSFLIPQSRQYEHIWKGRQDSSICALCFY
jgi:hypothetical protein